MKGDKARREGLLRSTATVLELGAQATCTGDFRAPPQHVTRGIASMLRTLAAQSKRGPRATDPKTLSQALEWEIAAVVLERLADVGPVAGGAELLVGALAKSVATMLLAAEPPRQVSAPAGGTDG